MRKSRKLLSGLLVLLLLLTLTVGGVYSYMFHRSETATNQLTPATVTCEVAETFADDQKTSVTVQNTGNIPAYLRVRLVTYWVNDKDEIVAKPSAAISVTPAEGWLADTDNDTYYYKYPVNAGVSTLNLLAAPLRLTQSAEGYKQVIEVFAEAIQADGTTDEGETPAVTDAWGVTVNADKTLSLN